MTQLMLLDVGHGNCAIVRSGNAAAIIDCPTGSLLLDTLRDLKITIIDTVIISHADRDHIAGIQSLLISETVRVKRIYVNPDSRKSTRIWKEFRIAVAVAERRGACEVVPALSTTSPGAVSVGEARITVLYPTAAIALTGVGGTTPAGRILSANSLSAVLRVDTDNAGRGALLAADMDEVGLAEMRACNIDLSADVLVFPHHGGLPGNADPQEFTTGLLDAVKPQTIVFSNGREGHDNPRSEIIELVRRRACVIACTQLSQRCQAQAVDADAYLESLRARGRHAGASCAGSLTFKLAPHAHRPTTFADQHQNFITDRVATPMCRGGGPL